MLSIGMLSVTRVPEAIVIDRAGILRYRGAVVVPASSATRQREVAYLERAIEDLLARRVVRTTETKPWGNTIP